ncbi:P-loop containing nucleoside triphosphate hydrolase protein [Meira miltonrushii]|uniref:P-loop containing nucleoside triphosphate hydrolase protein n=1 Tax=Meira miltonrushii TaxID=1280837 RepID=A0A316V2Z6_9BASI|nr:P-loop containing nucleoside triphosphate hydrolase protein [Meira miltonrushii]PWN31368.1 P-loop containing nucleoside triphosphate hydrolase protein [Meira miltonrushii]
MENRIFIFTWQDDERKGKTLVAEVHKWASQLHDEFWVFNGVKGGWRKDKAFFKAVQSAKAEDLILSDSILKDLRRDTVAFFKCQSLYESLAVPWKRGILLLGPPGNGKTGSIKILAKTCAEIGIPTLYVQTAKTRAGPEYGLTAIFQKARSEAPCMLVLEDIETLATDETRTKLLNQLDGIESNDGVLVVATANDVSKLDAAILQRPSRFDTKYTFDLPNQNLRKEFFSHWLKNKIGFAQIRVNEEDF